jgi:osmotically-inducible protein OsmY
MNRKWTLVSGTGLGAGLGAVLMYLFDPERGRRRRAMVRNKSVHFARMGRGAVEFASRGVSQRMKALRARLSSRCMADLVSDDVLAERVRSNIGHVVSHPGSIDVLASGGRIILTGPILAREVDTLLERVGQVRGTKEVVNRLEIHEGPSHVPGLQGGTGVAEGSAFPQ